MSFFESQRRLKQNIGFYIFTFFCLLFVAAFLFEVVINLSIHRSFYLNFYKPYFGIGFLLFSLVIACYYYFSFFRFGGSFVALSLGAKPVLPTTTNFKERQLYNIVEEISLASSLPVPKVLLLDAKEINAFASGTKEKNYAITVTTGSLDMLTREELQSVVAHEFGHLVNKDVKLNTVLAAFVMSFLFFMYLGFRVLESSYFFSFRSRDDQEGNNLNYIYIVAFSLILLGAVTWFFGKLLQSLVSRQKEYLADSCAVQYTRNPLALVSVLKKIAKNPSNDMPKKGIAYSHLYFNDNSLFSFLFRTHPPLKKRINAILGGKLCSK